MSADTQTSRRISAPVALFFGANAVAQFAIQAVLAYGFGEHVWGLGKVLAFAVPVALDSFAITLMIFAYQLRFAPPRQRAYVWFWLGVAIACQVGAAEGFAAFKEWNAWGRWASLFPSIFLAATLHALIINARKRDHGAPGETLPGWLARRRTARAVAREIKAERLAASKVTHQTLINSRVSIAAAHAAAVIASTREPAPLPAPLPAAPTPPELPAPPDDRPVPTPRPRPARRPRQPLPAGGRGRQPNPLKDILIKRCTVGGENVAAVAKELGLPVRSAQLWVKGARAATAGDHAGAGERP